MIVKLFDHLKLSEIGLQLGKDDPGNEDISFLLEVSQEIPRNEQELEHMDASQLASRCLSAFQSVSELLSKSAIWMNLRKIQLDSTGGTLIATSSQAATIRKEVVKSDDSYVKAAQEFEKGKAYTEFFTRALSLLEMGHYWAKGREQRNSAENKINSYEPHAKGVINAAVRSNFVAINEKNHLTNPVEDVTY